MLKTSKRGTGKRSLSRKPTTVDGGDKSQCGSSSVVPVTGGRPVLLQKPGVAVTESLPVPVTGSRYGQLVPVMAITRMPPAICTREVVHL